ncbi:MAG TPA: 4-(cytidine 5'-diphospho)-2-C-methyl-D-erythritol kinase [Steroidobacteraceae bacterium]|nr:4-(cytidine 5'-diphospho)-2-C-methyl-D-erythritol kinase [Steroidobacteraceae bacterium]
MAESGEWRWWPAPAKLNLFLHITARRADGFHELQTVFQLVDLCDAVGIAPRDDGILEMLEGAPGVAPEQDLALRAARLLQLHTGTRLGASLKLKKRIPMGGGLGGGSSDAATVLRVLDHLWGTGLGPEKLGLLGLALGSDVPVFVAGSSAWGEGRGERLTPVELPERWFLILHPGPAISTASVFQAPELTRNSPVLTIRAILRDDGRNDCEPVVRVRYPEVAEALDWLGAHAAARLSGTGACLFASFGRAADAERVAARVPDRWRAWVARGLQRSPLVDALATE